MSHRFVMKELPDDVIDIIREYSKPSFIHFREYNEAIHTFRIKKWTNLKEKIGNPEIREALKTCMDAIEDHRNKEETYELHKDADLCNRADWWREYSKNRLDILVDGQEHHGKFVNNFTEWSLRMSDCSHDYDFYD